MMHAYGCTCYGCMTPSYLGDAKSANAAGSSSGGYWQTDQAASLVGTGVELIGAGFGLVQQGQQAKQARLQMEADARKASADAQYLDSQARLADASRNKSLPWILGFGTVALLGGIFLWKRG